jgi:hypothetical protein
MSKITRQPSIHITWERMVNILIECAHKFNNVGCTADVEDLVDSIFAKASKHALNHRKLLAGNQKHAKTNTRIKASTLDDARTFAITLMRVRKAEYHKGVTVIKESSRDWLVLKEVTQLALNFMQDFDLEKNEAFTMYIRYAIKRMKQFSLNKFHFLHEAICLDYQAYLKILKDPTPSQTQRVMDIYNGIIAEKTGSSFDYQTIPDKYQYFIDVKQECQRLGIKFEDYIKSQFAAFDWRSAVPEVSQLVGAKALERLNKYLFQNGISVKGKPREISIDFAKIKEPRGKHKVK